MLVCPGRSLTQTGLAPRSNANLRAHGSELQTAARQLRRPPAAEIPRWRQWLGARWPDPSDFLNIEHIGGSGGIHPGRTLCRYCRPPRRAPLLRGAVLVRAQLLQGDLGFGWDGIPSGIPAWVRRERSVSHSGGHIELVGHRQLG